MNKLFRLSILSVFLLSACQSPPKADAFITFVKDGCTYDGPDGLVDNPVVFQYTNTNDHENFGIAVVTLQEAMDGKILKPIRMLANQTFWIIL